MDPGSRARLCDHHDIAACRKGGRGGAMREAVTKIIGVCKMTVLRMIRSGEIKERQVCSDAPPAIFA